MARVAQADEGRTDVWPLRNQVRYVCVCVRRQACCVDVLDAPRTHVPDFWKKFEGTYIKLEKCAMPPKQSVETHSVWFLVPPPEHPDTNWDLLPPGARDIEPVNEHYGWVVEFHNQISDTVVQDGHQALCNLKALLLHLKSRHPQLTTCSRETDGAVSYNSVAVALFTASLGDITGIRVTEHSHNEPGLQAHPNLSHHPPPHTQPQQVTEATSVTLLAPTQCASACATPSVPEHR